MQSPVRYPGVKQALRYMLPRPKAPSSCPQCGGRRLIPIAYGLPGPELFEAAERGEVILGGCLVDDANPLWQCASCGARCGGRGSVRPR
jgi:hypothetical protein